jgi:lipoyl(octanoyl) transferase
MHKTLPIKTESAAPQGVEWRVDDGLVAYDTAIAGMERRVAAIAAGEAPELVWLLQHPPLYTAGTSARDEDLLAPGRFPVHRTGRGGELTYHGPGQRVAYVMLDLRRRGADVRRYVCNLEDWIIRALATFNVTGERRDGRVGIWVDRGGGREDKIAAIGVRIRRWVTFHGIAINVEPELEHFSGIVPCGIAGANYGVTSLVDLGLPVTMTDLDVALKETFAEVFDAQQIAT